MNSVLSAILMSAAIGMPRYKLTEFNINRDNDQDALKIANLKIALAQEKNRKQKENRRRNRLTA